MTKANKVTTATPTEERFSILSEAGALRERMQNWYVEFTSREGGIRNPILVNPVPSWADDLFPSLYVYSDVLSATTITTYYSYLVVLNKTMDSLQPDVSYAIENLDHAQAICMSVDYCSHAGYCGAQAMRIALPFARSALPQQYDAWTNGWIEKFSGILNAARIQPFQPDK